MTIGNYYPPWTSGLESKNYLLILVQKQYLSDAPGQVMFEGKMAVPYISTRGPSDDNQLHSELHGPSAWHTWCSHKTNDSSDANLRSERQTRKQEQTSSGQFLFSPRYPHLSISFPNKQWTLTFYFANKRRTLFQLVGVIVSPETVMNFFIILNCRFLNEKDRNGTEQKNWKVADVDWNGLGIVVHWVSE